MRLFDKKIGKFWTLEKLENMMRVFFEEIYQIGKPQNMPVVSGRLGIIMFKYYSHRGIQCKSIFHQDPFLQQSIAASRRYFR